MKRAHAPSSAAVLALVLAMGLAAGGAGTARAAQQETAAEPAAGRGDAGASRIQLQVVVTASGGGEGTVRTWRVTTRAFGGPREGTHQTRAIDLRSTPAVFRMGAGGTSRARRSRRYAPGGVARLGAVQPLEHRNGAGAARKSRAMPPAGRAEPPTGR